MNPPARPLLIPCGLSLCLTLAPTLARAGAPEADAASDDAASDAPEADALEADAPEADAASDDAAADAASDDASAADAQASGAVSLSSAGADADADASADTDASADAPSRGVDSREYKRTDVPWIRRWAPERNMAELGIYGGLFFPADDHDFYNPASGQKPLWKLNGSAGLRAAFFPLEYLGIEAEGGVMPSRVRNSTNDFALLWSAGGHIIGQLPFWSVTPFVLIGAKAMGTSGPAILLGNDVDPAMHWGGGLKVYVNRWLAVRVEGRHILSAKEATQNSVTSHAELLFGLSLTLPRAKPKPTPPPNPDRDGDGFPNERDSCPDTPGVSPDGCPPRDSDNDGWVDTEDACPYEAGVEPDGCPVRDRDGDGIPDERDSCPDQPETDNGYEDTDGCPDEIPEKVREFTGVIEGIEFEYDSAGVRDVSKPILDRAIEVLEEYPDIRIEVVGHTDNEGTAEYNEALSKERADAVKQYLVDGGIASDRVETRGAGQSEPIASNDSEDGRAKNRRTEFKIIKAKRVEP
ncbi:OmpA family protein [Pseudenhygromyxa sp. WMMC2535]|uniref:OmpA family protein n=1 Tax=Pseudenhygromyxa sp. WMMC2535 TaxID=2712867 RepID=UPI00155660E8|nr:OmpA family protein [Pseudenhygromyxa sp. WMMC2535]NVB37204.1 OmpA family protein [Pseudenhygromyxa sp. WMMC2535]